MHHDWEKSDIIYFINHVINDIIRPTLKNTDFDNVQTFQQFAQVVKKHLQEIIPRIKDKFPKHNNGYYKYTWLDSDAGCRWEANFVLDYIFEHRSLLENIIKETWGRAFLNEDFINFLKKDLYNNPAIIDDLHLAVRKYLVQFNQDININKSNNIASNNDNVTATFDENGELIIPENARSITLDFEPRDDSQRERPVVIIREYIHDNGNDIDLNKYKDHIILGKRGTNHGSILGARKYQSLLANSIIDDNPTIACCYAVGKIAIIDNMRMFFPSVGEVKKALEQSGKFKKVYVYPGDDRIIYRVAKRLGRLLKKGRT